tara:strand:+ start:511 stop:819 length:309 start_codon:yes stop_codon:yes gene_type:complete
MRKTNIKALILLKLIFFSSNTISYSKDELSFYTTIEILREKKYDYDQKKRWVMANILSLDENEYSRPYLLKKDLLQRKFSKYKENEKKRRELQLKEWEEVLK